MRSIARSVCVWIAALFVLSACGAEKSITPVFHAEDNPPLLSDWHVIEARSGQIVLAEGVVPYDLNSALFTDYAHKLRTVWVPEGETASYNEADAFEFPVGTIISKTFYYPLAKGEEGTVIYAKDTTPERLKAQGSTFREFGSSKPGYWFAVKRAGPLCLMSGMPSRQMPN